MVVDQAERVQKVFLALSDPTRRDILRRTVDAELSVTQLALDYPMSFAAVQKHVAVMERAGLVGKRSHGREVLVGARVDTLREARMALEQLEELWRGRINRIEHILTTGEEGEPDGKHPDRQGH